MNLFAKSSKGTKSSNGVKGAQCLKGAKYAERINGLKGGFVPNLALLGGIGAFIIASSISISGCTNIIAASILKDPELNRTTRKLAADEGYRVSMLTSSKGKLFEVNILKTPLMLISDVTELEDEDDTKTKFGASFETSSATSSLEVGRCIDSDTKTTPKATGLKWRIFVVPAVGVYSVEFLRQKGTGANNRLSLAFSDMESMTLTLPYLLGINWEELAAMLETKTPEQCTELMFENHDGYNFPAHCTNAHKSYVFNVNEFVVFNDGFYFPKEFTWNAGITQNASEHESVQEVVTSEHCFTVRGAAPIKGTSRTNDIFRVALGEVEDGISKGRIRKVSASEGIILVDDFLK